MLGSRAVNSLQNWICDKVSELSRKAFLLRHRDAVIGIYLSPFADCRENLQLCGINF